jgi:hypothetical protein
VPVFCAKYKAEAINSGKIVILGESYIIRSKLSKDIFYSKFMKEQFKHPHDAYPYIDRPSVLEDIINKNEVKTPSSVVAKMKDDGTLRLHKKIFDE